MGLLGKSKSEFMSAFNELDFDSKVKAMNYVSRLKNEK